MANPINLNQQTVAIEDYDPVSYFTGHPVVGNPQITSTYGEATYSFTSEDNKAKFDADPEHYIPQ